jgi:hypothetical protein
MKPSITAKGLIKAIERRLTAISEQQHALAVERTRLLEHATPLRLGVVAPETALVLLRDIGITLPGVRTGRPPRRRAHEPVLRAVPKSAVAVLPVDSAPGAASAPIPIQRRGLSGAS